MLGNTAIQNTKFSDDGDFILTYKPNPNSQYDNTNTSLSWLKNEKLLESEIDFFNQYFQLPYDVEIVAQECNEINAFYYSDTKQIVICYELVDDVFETWYLFNENESDVNLASNYAYSVIDYIFLHEMGHAIIDIYDLPITGLEENVADQFASLMLSYTYDEQTGEHDIGQNMMYDIGIHYLYEYKYWNEVYPQQLKDSGQNIEIEIPYWGEHGLDLQRFYNISCYAYGADPKHGQFLIDENWLPKERAINCEYEYWKIDSSWRYLLEEYTNGFFD